MIRFNTEEEYDNFLKKFIDDDATLIHLIQNTKTKDSIYYISVDEKEYI